MPETKFEAVALSKWYDKARPPILENVSFTVPPGAIMAVVGNNGAGKSVLLRICAGIEKPTLGGLRLKKGEKEVERDRWNSEVFYVCLRNIYTTPRRLKIADVVYFHQLYSLTWESERCGYLMSAFGLRHDRDCETLSQGESVLLQLSVGVSLRPALLLIDEGLSVLHENNKSRAFQAIKDYGLSGGACLFSSNITDDVKSLANRRLELIAQGNDTV